MNRNSFYRWLKIIKKYDRETCNLRVENCREIENYYGNLDQIYAKDKFESLREEFKYSAEEQKKDIPPKHKVPISEDIYNKTTTLRNALNLYSEFKDNKLLQDIMTADDIIPDEHDGSYELVRETIESLSRIDLHRIDIPDLDMLYFMAVGTWKGGVEFRLNKIGESNLSLEEKDRLKLIFNNVIEKAKNHKYENSGVHNWSIGMFGTGFYTFSGKSDKEDAQKFISLCISIKDLNEDEKIFNITEEALKNGIKGMQTASASIILHCLKPNVFPIINNAMIEAVILLEGKGVILNKPGQLTTYIENSRKIKKFRDEECKFRNYRTLDMKFWKIEELKEEKPEFSDPIDISQQQWVEMLTNRKVFKEKDIKLVMEIFDMGGKATASELARRNNKHDSSYNGPVAALSKRIQKHTNCDVPKRENGGERWWHVLFHGNYNNDGTFNWILRPELKGAISERYNQLKREIEGTKAYETYTREDFLEEVFMEENQYENILALLEYKKNIIIQGPPGVGKTFIAKRIAYSIMGEKDDSKIGMIQFHQSYSYEDFIMGYRPIENGFELKYGVFYQFCEQALNDPHRDYYFIIDEINRGNISKIFGELMMLIEFDKRGSDYAIPLTYTENKFYIPKNIYIIGTMNTADRSLAMIDYALRRRFCFINIKPAFDNLNFKGYLGNKGGDLSNIIIDKITKLNKVIENDISLGGGFCIGHSYFCMDKDTVTEEDYKNIIKYEILPLLSEYWFDDSGKVTEWKTELLEW